MKSNIDFIVSRRAESNVNQILQYTFETWGSDQEDAYRAILLKAFERIRAFPDIGHPIEGRPSNIRIYHLEHHAIEYRRTRNRVTILRVINPRRHPSRRDS